MHHFQTRIILKKSKIWGPNYVRFWRCAVLLDHSATHASLCKWFCEADVRYVKFKRAPVDWLIPGLVQPGWDWCMFTLGASENGTFLSVMDIEKQGGHSSLDHDKDKSFGVYAIGTGSKDQFLYRCLGSQQFMMYPNEVSQGPENS